MAGAPCSSFVLALVLIALALGCEGESAPPPRPAQPAAPPAQAVQPAAPQPTAEGPIVAEVNGKRIEGFAASYQRGLLTLYTGEDPDNHYGDAITFWGLPEKPSGERISFPARAGTIAGAQMTYKKEDPSVNTNMRFLLDRRYELKLGEERDYKVTVTVVSAEATDPVAVKVRGTVVARTAGIEMKDGVIDRSFDHLDTIKWITREWIHEHREVKSMSDAPDTCLVELMSKKNANPAARQVAACSYRYLDGRGKLGIAKLWLEKLDGSWKVVSEIEPSQTLRAHPIKPPDDRAPYVFERIAALRFEQEIYRPAGGFKRVGEPLLISCGGGQVDDQPGYCEITFTRSKRDRDLGAHDAPGCHFVTYLLTRDSKGSWQITKTLGATQRYDPFKQKVEPRDLPMWCDEK